MLHVCKASCFLSCICNTGNFCVHNHDDAFVRYPIAILCITWQQLCRSKHLRSACNDAFSAQPRCCSCVADLTSIATSAPAICVCLRCLQSCAVAASLDSQKSTADLCIHMSTSAVSSHWSQMLITSWCSFQMLRLTSDLLSHSKWICHCLPVWVMQIQQIQQGLSGGAAMPCQANSSQCSHDHSR